MIMPVNPRLSRRTLMSGLGAGALGLGTAAVAGCSPGASDPERPKGLDGLERKELGAELDGPLYPDGYVGPRARELKPFADGSRTFKIVVSQDASVVGDWNKNAFSAWMEKTTGVKVEYQAVLTQNTDGSADLTKINAMLASGELPDAFLGIPFTAAQISLYGSQGVFVALDDYIETLAPAMRQARQDYPDLTATQKSLDGKIYQFKALSDCYHCKVSPARAWINRRFLERVDAEMPTTTEELRQVLRLFKDRDPSGTGAMLPLAAGVNGALDTYFMNAFLYNPGGRATGGWLRLNADKVEFVANTDAWREGIRFLHSLYDDGTLTKESFTMTNDAVLKAGNQGRIGFARRYYQGDFIDVDLEPDSPWRDYVAVPPLKGPQGVQYSGWDYTLLTGPPFVITSSCPAPELLVQWADTQLDLTAQCNAYAGVQGDNWDWAKEGDPGLNGEQAVWRAKQWPAPSGQSWSLRQIYYLSSGFRNGQYSNPKSSDFEKELYQATTAYEPFAEPRDQWLPPLIFDETQAAQQADLAQTIDGHVKQSLAAFVTAENDIDDDSAWQAYQQKFEEMRLPDYLALYQQAYDNRPR